MNVFIFFVCRYFLESKSLLIHLSISEFVFEPILFHLDPKINCLFSEDSILVKFVISSMLTEKSASI